ncbi:MAG: hypothetical protein AAGN66_04885 [Acidobacteriota bacterium]
MHSIPPLGAAPGSPGKPLAFPVPLSLRTIGAPWVALPLMMLPLLFLGGPPPASAQPSAVPRGVSAPPGNPDACSGGVVLDDGTVETGYGWVPSVVEGEYVQEFQRADFDSGVVAEVCVCWLRTDFSDGPDIEFDLVFYSLGEKGMPLLEPFASVPASASVPDTGVENGQLVSVDVGRVDLPLGPVYMGVRWDASVGRFFFLCADHTDANPVTTNVFFKDEQSEGWSNVLESTDPIFRDHRAAFIRAVGAELEAVDIPALPVDGLILLAIFLAGVGLVWLSRRRTD